MSPSDYRTIQQELLRRIHTRMWPAGMVIPTETALAVEFGCARATINRALGEIAKTGLIDRKRKAGTTISLNPVRKAVMEIPVTRQEVESQGQAYRHKMLAQETLLAPDHVRARMNLPQGAAVLHLKTVHLADGRPYIYEDRWINTATVPGILTAPLKDISANEWLVRNAPFSGGDIVFTAEAATASDAAALAVPTGAPLFIVERLTRAGEATITLARLAYAPGYRKTTQI